jgi:hypothetical protein
VELLFKRLKSLLVLDGLRAHDPDVVHSYVYGKLIAAALVQRISRQSRAFSPWGLPLPATAAADPVALL